jgi:3-hydroxyisobutyrate dehydrogenase
MNKEELDLNLILCQIWNYLSRGADSSKSNFHLASLGTVKDNYPKVRTVVLRKVIMEETSLIFHTDIRSGKFGEIQSNRNVSLLFYSKEDKIQIRLEGTASLHVNDELGDRQWHNSRLTSRKCYLAEPAPGTESLNPASGIPEIFAGRLPTEEESEPGRENFCAVKVKVNEIDWFYLSSSGHVRAKFDLRNDDVKSSWIIP